MDLIAIANQLGTDEQCLNFIERMRWPEGMRCPICGCDKVSKFTVKETTRKVTRRRKGQTPVTETVTVPARHLYQCLEPTCNQQFAATTGTLFHDTHLPLQKWFFAVALMVNAKKGLSARQMKRDLNVSYETAWYLCHRIREAMESEGGLFSGEVELDETFIGGRFDPRRHAERQKHKQAVMGLIQRSTEDRPTRVLAFPIPDRKLQVIAKVANDHIAPDAQLYTDEFSTYRHLDKMGWNRAIVIHSKGEYVRGNVHTNTIEGFWSLFERQLAGQHHWVSVKHLQRYLNESTYKYNNRKAESLFLLVVISLLAGKPVPYARLIED